MLVYEGRCLMILTQDQEPKRVIEELREEEFTHGDIAKGELNDVLIEKGVPLFFLSFFGTLTSIVQGDGGALPEKVNFNLSIPVPDGWYEISEVIIRTTSDEVTIEGTQNTKFISMIPDLP